MESTERDASAPMGLWGFANHTRTVSVMGTIVRLVAPTVPTERAASDPMGLRSSAGHISGNNSGEAASKEPQLEGFRGGRRADLGFSRCGDHRRPALGIAALPATRHNTIDEILAESIQREEAGVELYRELLALVKDKSVVLEEYATRLVSAEAVHCERWS